MKTNTESYTFDDIVVKVVKRPLMERIGLKFEVIQIIGVSAVKMIGDLFKVKKATGTIKLDQINIPEIVEHLENLFMKLTPQKAQELIKELLINVFLNDADVNIDEVFNNYFEKDPSLIYKVVGFALVVQLKDFFFKGSTSELMKILEEKLKNNESEEPKKDE